MPLINPFQKSKFKADSCRVHMEDPDSILKISSFLSLYFAQIPMFEDRPKVIVCIGTDRSTGDSLGPLVGSKLLTSKNHDFKVMGTLDEPVHASNLRHYLNVLETLNNPFVLAVDACLGKLDSVGFINLRKGALRPGAGVNKNLPAVGDLNITGIVNVGGFMEYFVLQNTRLNTVMKMANIISDGLVQSSSHSQAHGLTAK